MENNADNEYALSDGERAELQALNSQVNSAKLAVYSLNVQLEAALKEVASTEARWLGALGLLATAHGMDKVILAPDLSRIKRSK